MSAVRPASPPAPVTDVESAPWWEALRAHRIVLQRCTACHRLRFPRMPGCPYCGALGHSEEEVSGHGRVYAMVRVHRALTPAVVAEVPYTVATVQLDDGPRLVARVAGDAESLHIDSQVVPHFVDHDGWTELRYEAAP